jgi:hypothetical protein
MPSGMSDSAERAMMRAARNIVAPAMRRIARIRTKETAAAVNIHSTARGIEVRAGTPTGPYGWEPIQALMFEQNKRHPLFGNTRKWYHEGYFPITEMTVKLVAKLVEDEFVQEDLRIILGEYGFK